MKLVKYVFTLVVLGTLSNCQEGETEESVVSADTVNDGKRVERVSRKEFNEYANSHEGEVLIVDVRTPGEYAEGFIPGAVNMDFYGANFQESLSSLDKTKPTLIYCHSGGRSSEALQMMKDQGFEFVLELEGGYSSWTP